mgnify:FL=1
MLSIMVYLERVDLCCKNKLERSTRSRYHDFYLNHEQNGFALGATDFSRLKKISSPNIQN